MKWLQPPVKLQEHNPLLVVVAAIAGLFCAKLLVSSPKLLIVFVGGIVGLTMTFKYPRPILMSVFPLLLIEGALRKWVLPSAQEIIYFVKDGVLILIFIHWLISIVDTTRETNGKPLPVYVTTSLIACVIYILLEILNPHMPNMAFYVYSLRTYLLPLTLLAVIPYYLNWQDYERIQRLMLWSLVPIGMLAIIQSGLGTDHWLNAYARNAAKIASFGSEEGARVRATSTFSYLNGLTAYLLFISLSISYIFRDYFRENITVLIGMVSMAVVAALMTGSRGCLFMVVVGTPVTFLPLLRRQFSGRTVRILVSGVILASALTIVFEDPITQFRFRVEKSQHDVSARISSLWLHPLQATEIGGLFGKGLGTTHQSRDQLLNRTERYGRMPKAVEGETAQIVIEIGGIGASLWYLFRLMLVVYVAQMLSSSILVRDQASQLFFMGLLVYSIFIYPSMTIFNGTQFYLYCFFLAGARLIPVNQKTELT